jgi:tetratricopeptide (TPR) repeat protein
MQGNFLNKTLLHLILIAVLSLIAYSNTFDSSFHYDDKRYIVDNPVIKDLTNFVQPSSSSDFSVKFKQKTFSRRYIGYLSFALNYRLHGLNVIGYHIVNLFVHICTSVLFYFFIVLTFKTPFLSNSAIRQHERHIALFAALLCACHPLQTQAVTYIWQRVTSLCTMFYLLSVVSYIKWRLLTQEGQRGKGATGQRDRGTEAEAGRHHRGTGVKTTLLYLISLICTVLAMKTKEIAFMLPVMLTLYEMIFFKGNMKKRVLYLIPFLLTMLIIPITTISGERVENLDNMLRGGTQIPRAEYLLAQFRVLITYLRLIFLPFNQNLAYDYPRYYSFFNMEVFISFIFLATLFGVSVYMLFRYSDSAPHTRLVSYGMIWFFVNLMIESSIIPLHNVIYEHRMYLPSVGVFSAITTVIFMLIIRWRAYARVITVMLAVVIIVFTGATYARNTVWKDELTLWLDVVSKSPNKVESLNNLAVAYASQGLYDKAVEHYLLAVKLEPYNTMAYFNLANSYASQGLSDQAIKQYLLALRLKPDYPEAHHNLGNVYASEGLLDQAIKQYLLALKFKPDHTKARYNLGAAYHSQGLLDQAIKQYLLALKFQPNYPEAHHNLGNAYASQGLLDKAIKQYLLALKFKPNYPEAYYNLGMAYNLQGDTAQAIKEYNKALRLRPGWELPRNALEQISKGR